MQQIAPGLQKLRYIIPNFVNMYIADGILIDSGWRTDRGAVLRQLRGLPLTAHALTHVHPDHQGNSAFLCGELGLPLWAGIDEAGFMESGNIGSLIPNNWNTRFQLRFLAGPGHPVGRRLREGDAVGSFSVVATPGHSPGHISFWRPADGVLIAGDALFNLPKLSEPPAAYTLNPARNRESIRKLAALSPKIICFGHGPVLRNSGQLEAFAAKL